MSGPKTSQYMLTPEQRRILMEQRMIQRECELLAKQQADLRSVIAQADDTIGKIKPLLEETEADKSALENAETLRSEMAETISTASKMDRSSSLASLQEMNQKLRELSGQLDSATQTLRKSLGSADQSFRKEMAERISEGFRLSFANLGSGGKLQSSEAYQKIQKALEEISGGAVSEELRRRMVVIREKAHEITDSGFLKNFYAMTVLPFVKECRAYQEAYRVYGAEYDRKKFLYESNARVLGIEAEDIPFSTEAISLLDAKLRETESAIQFREEQAYISRCVDEALREMGYSVLGSREIVKRNGKKFRNELYLFDEGTAVNVTYASDGQITMELGGMDREDRIPTKAESEALVSDMHSFCEDYSEMERRLRAKGVVTRRISILPADAQFAQIINISDYDLCGEVSEYKVRKEKRQETGGNTRKIGE